MSVYLPPQWTPKSTILQPEYVYDSFKILSLLDYHKFIGSQLDVPHSTRRAHHDEGLANEYLQQSYRFDEAMRSMNRDIDVAGQPEINHR